MQAAERFLVFSCSRATHLAGSNDVGQQFADDSQVGRTAIAGHAVIPIIRHVFVFRRRTRSGNQLLLVLRVLDEPLQAEIGSTLHQRKSHRAQILLILREQVTLPKRIDKPRSAEIPVGPLGFLALLAHRVGHRPEVAVMTGTPAAADAVVVLGGMATILGQSSDEAIQRFCHLCEIADKGWPVVLLQVDIHGVVAAPRRPQMWRPQALQIGRHALGARTTDEHVAAILEIKCLQIARRTSLISIVLEQLVGGYREVFLVSIQRELQAVVVVLVVGDVTLTELLIAEVLGVPDIVGSLFQIGSTLLDGMLVKAIEAGAVDDVDDGLLSITDSQTAVAGLDGSLFGISLKDGAEMDALHRVAYGMARLYQLVA